MTTTELLPLILLGGGAFLLIGAAVHFTGVGSLNNIKSKTVGDGQHGTARWATKQEIRKTYRHIPFRPDLWRQGKEQPTTAQGLVLGCVGGGDCRLPHIQDYQLRWQQYIPQDQCHLLCYLHADHRK